jgi:PEGA domain
MRRYGLWLAALLCCGVAHADPSTATPAARTYFESGLAAVERGELEAALASFQAAYALQPHYSVLFNIGQALAALGRPVEAAESFERFLNEGGARLSGERREEAQALLTVSQRRTGQLEIIGVVEGTRVWLDGREVAPERLKRPISLPVGKHAVLYVNADGPPMSRDVDIESLSLTKLTIEPHLAPAATTATLLIVCPVPGVAVEVDGVAVSLTPVSEPLRVLTGTRTLRFQRAGYREVVKRVESSAERVTRVSCDQRPNAVLAPGHQARLTVRAAPSDAEVFLNGERHLGGAVPIGAHDLTVYRDGFEPYRQRIVLAAKRDTAFEIQLRPTRAQRVRQADANRRRRTLGVVLAGSGLAMAGAGAAIFAWNANRYDDWQSHRDPTGNDLGTVASIQQADDLALATGALATGLLLSGAWFLMTEEPSTP